jgi:hypothetical protein
VVRRTEVSPVPGLSTGSVVLSCVDCLQEEFIEHTNHIADMAGVVAAQLTAEAGVILFTVHVREIRYL